MKASSDSGLPPKWAWATVEDILASDLCNGRSVPTAAEGGFPVLRLTALTNGRVDLSERKLGAWTDEDAAPFLVSRGDFFVARGNGSIRLVGRGALLDAEPDPVAFPDTMIRVRLNKSVVPKLFAEVWHSLEVRRQIERKAKTTAGIYKINQKDISTTGVPLAPLPEQGRIVEAIESYFTRLDDAVATLVRVQRNLKRYRASVLKAAVEGRLVPTESELARAEGRDHEPASVLLERILKERRRRWEEAGGRGKYKEPIAPDTSDLPELPEGWCWATVEQLSSKVVDGVHKKPDYVESGIPFVTVKNLTAGPGISFEHLKYVTRRDHEQYIRRANPEPGDILISKDRTLGVTRAIRTDAEFSIFVSVALVKPVQKLMTDYLEIAFSAPQVQVQMVPKGSGLQHIHLEDLRRDCIPVPPLTEQARIVEAVQRQLTIAEDLEAVTLNSRRRCTRLRQAILKWAFEGKLADQDPSDEPAAVLLERIKTERETTDATHETSRRGRRNTAARARAT